MKTSLLSMFVVTASLAPSPVFAQPFSYGLAGGSADWPAGIRDSVVRSMDEAAALYNRHGFFEKRVTANFNAGVPTAQGNYDGWIDFGGSRNTRVALHEIAHTLGVGTYWRFDGGAWGEDSAAGRLIKLYDGRGARLNTGGTHFWPYGLNYDNEDGPAARERHVKLLSALRFDMGIVKDGDGDGLPDDWERHHFPDLARDGNGDADGDGVLDRHEYATDCDPNSAAPVADGRVYVLRCQRGGRALSVIGASDAEGAGTELQEPDGSTAQQWTAEYAGDGWFRLRNVKSGKVLQLAGTDTASALPIQQGGWTGALQQQWRITTGPGAEQGYYQIANRETARVVDGLDGADGADVKQYPFLGDIPQQFWRFDEVVAEEEMPDGGAAGDAGQATPGGQDAGGDSGVDAGVRADASMASDAALDGGGAGDAADAGDGGCSLAAPSQRGGLLSLCTALALAVLVRRRRR